VVWVAPLGAMAAIGKKTGRRIALAGLADFAIGFVCSELTKEMTMRPRPFAVLDHVRLLSADVGLISLPEAYGGCYDD
jgi:undecaprenyl-diphosphatase